MNGLAQLLDETAESLIQGVPPGLPPLSDPTAIFPLPYF